MCVCDKSPRSTCRDQIRMSPTCARASRKASFKRTCGTSSMPEPTVCVEPVPYPFCKNCSRMRSEGSRFIWGSGGDAVFAESCVCVRNRPQPSAPVATVRVRAVRLSTVASASGLVLKVCDVDPLSSQLYWSLQRRCLCE